MPIRALALFAFFFASSTLSHAKEFRAAWVASVYNINFPSRSGLSVQAQKAEIVRICDAAKSVGLNALMVQVRPESDALYDSRYEPWSRFLTGTQGKDPGYDPLEYFIREGRQRGIEIHAWINPYRAATSSSGLSSKHPVNGRLKAEARKLKKMLWLDPTEPAVQDHVVRVVEDIVKRYDVGGIHLDDYFFPYPETYSGSFPDSRAFKAYVDGGGKLARADWRRSNVNTMVRRLGEAVHRARSGAVFGVSPFGIYTKGQPSDVKAGLDALNQLYCDPVHWLKKGYVDYLAPQLYWDDAGPQSFSSLLRWWRSSEVNPKGIPIYPGIAIDRLNSKGRPAKEIARQLSLQDKVGPNAGVGFILWDFDPLLKNSKNVREIVRDN
ncbi:MAG: family 10 glycosylhydrolase [Chthoniobacterales bacterium]